MVVDAAAEEDVRNGRSVSLKPSDSPQPGVGNRCRAYTGDGHFLGVLSFDGEKGQWRPGKVFSTTLGR